MSRRSNGRGGGSPHGGGSDRHIPHLLLESSWDGAEIPLDPDHLRHLEKVLNTASGDPISYTNGRGTMGSGSYGDSHVIRGNEWTVDRPARAPLAVAPPKERQRLRFVVEKLAELGVPSLTFLRTERGEGRPPSSMKLRGWIQSAVEQSRGAWTMECSSDPVDLTALEPIWLAHPGGEPVDHYDGGTIAIGPEGGFSDAEASGHRLLDLGPTVLRVETAAVVAATSISSGNRQRC